MFLWKDYESKYAQIVDSWLDAEAVAMTGLDDGWEDYWSAVKADSVHFPGCEDFCKIIFEESVPFAAICFGIYQNTMTISEIVVDPRLRGQGRGTQLLAELVQMAKKYESNKVNRVTAVVYPKNVASQKAFQKAGFHLEKKTEDGVDLIFTYQL